MWERGTGKKRGHQHHPRNEGSRRPLQQATTHKPKEKPPTLGGGAAVVNANVVNNNNIVNENNNLDNVEDIRLVPRPAAEGSSQSDREDEPDAESEEWLKLRCTSERTEVVAERESRRRSRRCPDYPGLAFGSSIFSSDAMMKFSIIRNELHNIMKTQLRRVESEVTALNQRIQVLDEDLVRSQETLAASTGLLVELVAKVAKEDEKLRNDLESRTSIEVDGVSLLEMELSRAKVNAEEADKRYEDVVKKLISVDVESREAEKWLTDGGGSPKGSISGNQQAVQAQ